MRLNSSGVDSHELVLDRAHCAAGREAGPVRDAKDVRVDRDRRLAERRVQDDVRGLAADAGQRLERLAIARHLAGMLGDEAAQVVMRFFALLLNRPIVLM